MTGLEQLREKLADYLRERGVDARAAWPAGDRERVTGPVAVVSLRGCRTERAGFQDYLGERFNRETGLWEEVYGRKAEITFGLDLYAPAEADGAELQAAFEALAAALAVGGPEGLTVKELSCGETAYDKESRLLKRPVQLACLAWVYAAAGADGLFTDFIIRGGLKT